MMTIWITLCYTQPVFRLTHDGDHLSNSLGLQGATAVPKTWAERTIKTKLLVSGREDETAICYFTGRID